MRNTRKHIFPPFSTALNSSYNDMAILVSNTDLGSIRTPFHHGNRGNLAVVNHLIHPFPIMFHKYNDQPIAITAGQLPIFMVPVDHHYISFVVVEVGVLSRSPACLFLPRILQSNQLQEALTRPNSKPALIVIPCTWECCSLGRHCDLLL